MHSRGSCDFDTTDPRIFLDGFFVILIHFGQILLFVGEIIPASLQNSSNICKPRAEEYEAWVSAKFMSNKLGPGLSLSISHADL